MSAIERFVRILVVAGAGAGAVRLMGVVPIGLILVPCYGQAAAKIAMRRNDEPMRLLLVTLGVALAVLIIVSGVLGIAGHLRPAAVVVGLGALLIGGLTVARIPVRTQSRRLFPSPGGAEWIPAFAWAAVVVAVVGAGWYVAERAESRTMREPLSLSVTTLDPHHLVVSVAGTPPAGVLTLLVSQPGEPPERRVLDAWSGQGTSVDIARNPQRLLSLVLNATSGSALRKLTIPPG